MGRAISAKGLRDAKKDAAAGRVIQLPGQLYGLATGDFEDSGILGFGKRIAKSGEDMKSEALKQKEKQRSQKIQDAEDKGQWEAFKAAFGETVKDPALFASFIAEQAPQMLVPFGGAKVIKGLTLAKGLRAGLPAIEATQAAGTAGTRAAIGAGAVQQGSDIGAGAYEELYKALVLKGTPEEEAKSQALNLARAAGASGAVISLLAQRLPGAKTLEESFAGVPGTSGRLLGAAKGALGETASEIVEETGGKFAQNVAMRQVNPEQQLTQGLGVTAGMAAIGGGTLGGVAGALRTPQADQAAQPPPPPPEAPQIDPDKYSAVIKGLTAAIPDSGLTDSSKLGEIFKASGIENEAEVSAYLNQAIASGEIAANSNPVFNVSDANGKVLFSTVEKAVADKAAERLNAEDAGTATVAEATATKFTKPTGLPQGIEVRQGQFKQDMFNISRGDTILNPEPLSAEDVGQKAYRLSKITAGSTEANTKEIEVLQKKIDTNNTSKEKLEAAGEALSPEYATLSAQVDENNALIQAQIDEVKQKGSAFSGEISITPAKQSDEGFTLFKQGKPAEYFETEEDLNQALAAEPTIAGPTAVEPTIAGPTIAGPTAAGPTAVGTTAAGPTIAGTTAAGPTAVGTTAAGTTIAGTTAAGTTAAGQLAAGTTSEALAEARESLRQNLLPFMKKVGLESTGLRIMDSIENGQGESDGRYTKQLIDISLKAANPMGTLRHETIHALKELGAFSKQEWSLLESYAKKQWINQFLRQRKIGDSNYYDTYKKIYLEDNPSIAGFDEYIIEEAIADAFKYFSATKPPANIIGNIYRKVKALLEGMGNQLSGLGFQTADDVFKRVEAGQMKPTQQAGTGAAPRYQKEEESKYNISSSPKGVPQNIWDLHQAARLAVDVANGHKYHPSQIGGGRPISSGQLKRNQTMSFRRLNNAVKAYLPNDQEAQLKLMRDLNVESRRREEGEQAPRQAIAGAAPRYSQAIEESGDKRPFDLKGVRVYEKELQDIIKKVGDRIAGLTSGKTLTDVRAAVKKLQEYAEEGIEGAEWYEKSAKAVLDAFKGDKVLAEKFFQVIAITSAATEVKANFTMTYNAWQQAAEGKPIKVATEAKNKKISDLLNFGLDWEGRKTNSFYLNLMEAMEGVDTGKATIDLHMTRMLFDRDAPTDAQYELAEKMVRLLATKVNVPPRQIQAASWVTQKAKGLFKNFREKGQHKTLNDKELRFLSFQRALGDYSHAFKDKGAEFLPTTAALREPSSDIRARTEVITGEAVPSTKVPAGQVSEIPYKNKLAFNGQLVKAGVVDKIAKVIGLKSKIRASEGTGGYDKSINPNMIVRVVNFNPMVAKADADALSDAMSYVFQQDATPYFRADPKLISTGQVGFLIRFNPAKITITQERKLYKALQEELGDGAGYTKLKGAEIVLINYRDKESGNPFLMDDVAFEAAVDKFREKANAIIGIESSTAFGAESEYKYNDWENERTGKAIVERIQNSRADRPDISKGLDDLRNTFIKDAREAVKESGAIPRFSLQDSVEVDGVDRPTTDSRGRPIFSTLDGIKNFWRWFGDSVFVDDKGRPMVMYHGTAVDIEEFIPKQANAIFITPQVKFAADFKDGSLGGVATWSEGWMVENYEDILTPEQIERAKIKALFKIDAETKKDYRLTSKSHHSAFVETAEFSQELLDEMPSRANVLPLFVKADNPFNYENQNHVRQVVDRLFLDSGVDLETEPNGLIRFKDENGSIADKQYSENEVYKMLSKGYWPLIEQAETQEAIRGLGFDGFSVQEALTKNYAVYDSAQLKSSIGNTGEFSPKKKSIRYSISAPDTPEFKRWFGSSKVVDADGKPLVMYRGEAEPVTTYKTSKLGKTLGGSLRKAGFFFTSNEKEAGFYAQMRGTDIVNKVYLSIKNPFVVSRVVWKELADWGRLPHQKYKTLSQASKATEQLVAQAKADGHDGLFLMSNKDEVGEYVAFEPTQIKSATGNRGTFDPAKPDIRYSLADAPPIAGTDIEESLDGTGPYLNPNDEASREDYIYNNKGMVKWMNAAERDEAYQDALQQNLKRLGFPDEFIAYRGHPLDRPSPTTYANVTTNRGYADNFKKAYVNFPKGSKWVVDELKIRRDDVVALGAVDENELIVKLRDDALVKGNTTPKYSLRDDFITKFGQADLTNLNSKTHVREEVGYAKRLMAAFSPDSRVKLRAQIINRLEAIERQTMKVSVDPRYGGSNELLADVSATAAALQSQRASGIAAESFKRGVPVYANGFTSVSDLNGTVDGLIPIFQPLISKYKDPMVWQLFQFYSATRRGGRFIQEGREKLFTAADIQKGKDYGIAYPEFDSVFKEYQKYNEGLVKFQIDTGVLTPEMGRKWMMYSDYIPFYRQINGEETLGPKLFQNLSGVKPTPIAKGSDAKIADFLETIILNSRSAIENGMKNVAAQRIARDAMRTNSPNTQDMARKLEHWEKDAADVIHVRENGIDVRYKVADILLVEAMKGLGTTEMGTVLKFMAYPTKVLRDLVTKDPGFMLANLFRDSAQAYVTSGTNMIPVIDTFKQAAKILANQSPEAKALTAAGIGGGYEFSGDVKASAKAVSAALNEKAGINTGWQKALWPVTKVWEALEAGTTASDLATRAEIYARVMKSTNGNEAEAVYQALEVMNFGRMGSSPLIQVISALVPFFNARIQGMDVLYRAGTGRLASASAKTQQKLFARRAMYIMGMSIAYWMLARDTDEWKRASKETRDNYWIIGKVKIPIPFEIGTVFKVLPERILEYTFGNDTGEDLANSAFRNIASTLKMVPIPQAALPLVEAYWIDYSFFTGNGVVGRGMEKLDPQFQLREGTSLVAKKMGDITGMSPVKIDHVLQGYTGAMGMYVASAISAIIRTEDDGSKASMSMEQTPILKRFFASDKAGGSIDAFYEFKKQVETVVATQDELQKRGNPEQYIEYMKKNGKLLGAKQLVSNISNKLSEMRKLRNIVNFSKSMPPDQKRKTLDNIRMAEIRLTESIKGIRAIVTR
jgi:hypothetical protein